MEYPANVFTYEHLLYLESNLGNLLDKVHKFQATDGKLWLDFQESLVEETFGYLVVCLNALIQRSSIKIFQ